MFKIDLGIVRKFFVAVVINLALGGAMARERGGSSSTQIFLAGEAAYRDFYEKISRQIDSTSELSVYFSDIENYQITLQEDEDCYVVTFTPKRYKGQTLRGGGAQYKITKKDFHVVDIVRYK